MSVFNVIALLGGLAMFLYGMTLMGSGMEKLAGGKMEKTLERLTNNLFLSVALGAVVTATIQSSGATTVVVVGLVNAGILKLRQAVGVIMGANIGTTITAQILRLSDLQSDNLILTLVQPKNLAPMAAIVGIAFYMLSRKSKYKEIGQTFLGFSILFTGMFAMEGAVLPLQNSPVFVELLSTLSNPVLGVTAGAIVTIIIQSSSASVGILQAVSATGALHFSTAFPIIMGQNIGTCSTPLLASIGASKNAKRSALIHLYFNLTGTIVFMIAIYSLKALFPDYSLWNMVVGKGEIADFHTFFNVATTLMFLPFARVIEMLAVKTIKDPKDQKPDDLNLLEDRLLKSPTIALQQVGHVITSMSLLSRSNYVASVKLLQKFDFKAAERIREDENLIDRMEDRMEAYLLKLSQMPLSGGENESVSTCLHLINEFERIGDYSMNLTETAENMQSGGVSFSPDAVREVQIITNAVEEIIDTTVDAYASGDLAVAEKIEPLEETIDAMVETLKDMHIERLKAGKCNVHAGIVFLEILTNLERIADHCSNTGVYLLEGEGKGNAFVAGERHEYLKRQHEATDADYVEAFERYMEKYYSKIGKKD